MNIPRNEIMRIGRLGLGYKTFISDIGDTFMTNLGPIEAGLEIHMWSEDFGHNWTIGSFELNKKECTYEFNECGDRMANPDLNWKDFGILYNYGREMMDTVERFMW